MSLLLKAECFFCGRVCPCVGVGVGVCVCVCACEREKERERDGEGECVVWCGVVLLCLGIVKYLLIVNILGCLCKYTRIQ